MVTGRLIEVDLRNRASRSPTSKHHSFSENVLLEGDLGAGPETDDDLRIVPPP
jgi:hypothetical protein